MVAESTRSIDGLRRSNSEVGTERGHLAVEMKINCVSVSTMRLQTDKECSAMALCAIFKSDFLF